jgi:hypothetical protein
LIRRPGEPETALIGLFVLFHQGASGILAVVYAVILLIALVVFRAFWRKSPDEYGVGWLAPITPLTAVGVCLNLLGAAVSFAVGP